MGKGNSGNTMRHSRSNLEKHVETYEMQGCFLAASSTDKTVSAMQTRKKSFCHAKTNPRRCNSKRPPNNKKISFKTKGTLGARLLTTHSTHFSPDLKPAAVDVALR